MNYQIITGYWAGNNSQNIPAQNRADFFTKYWYPNTARYADISNLLVINSNSSHLPEKKGQWLDLIFNLGHVHDLDNNDYPNKKFGGWSMAFVIGALTAYSNNCDLIFKEQDCLTFGNWIEEMYKTLKETQSHMLIGSPSHANGQALEQSLFIIKHNLILPFITAYLALPYNDSGFNYFRPEAKFKKIIEDNFSDQVSELSFGYGRGRPSNLINSVDNEIFYIQHITTEELLTLNEYI